MFVHHHFQFLQKNLHQDEIGNYQKKNSPEKPESKIIMERIKYATNYYFFYQ